MAELTRPRPLIETDDREAFDCGRDSMNNWLRRNGWRNHITGMSRVSVIAKQESRTIIGYVTLSAAQIERAYLAKADQRNRPAPVPMALLGQLAVDLRFQRQGHAASLMLHALRTVVRFSREIGCFGAMTHPLDENVRQFYRGFGFVDLPGDPRRTMIVRVKDLEFNNLA
jgi:predicted N-acetyltransferase YhbS